ncbi:hypothetical protein [Streptococcus equi]|uniref:hypothetical protein n=1 Tax=Streptococcus equi TaxID=1336 RepID=UPI001E65C049|nr:hypothetical protein [Streptococcus equi]
MADKPITKASETANPVAAADKLPLDTNQSAEDIIAVKKAYIAKNTGLPLDKIQLLDTSEGKALMYPHDDHHHVILLDKIDVSKPLTMGRVVITVIMHTTIMMMLLKVALLLPQQL